MKSPVVKRSIVVAGHKTSVSLEEAFWTGMKEISGERNMTLSERRAEAVRDYLVGHFSIGASRLIAIGYGEERLKNTADPDAAENRRVEVVNLGP